MHERMKTQSRPHLCPSAWGSFEVLPSLFPLRHEGYLGGIGAWLKNLGEGIETLKATGPNTNAPPAPIRTGMRADTLPLSGVEVGVQPGVRPGV